MTFTINQQTIQPFNNSSWHKIAESVAEMIFSANGLTLLTVSGKTITVGIHNDQLFACAHKCPHAGGLLADGYVDATGNIVCPLHRYRFDPHTGRNTSGEGFFLKIFPVEVREEGVYVNIPGL